jgi:hypothetical protein
VLCLVVSSLPSRSLLHSVVAPPPPHTHLHPPSQPIYIPLLSEEEYDIREKETTREDERQDKPKVKTQDKTTKGEGRKEGRGKTK